MIENIACFVVTEASESNTTDKPLNQYSDGADQDERPRAAKQK